MLNDGRGGAVRVAAEPCRSFEWGRLVWRGSIGLSGWILDLRRRMRRWSLDWSCGGSGCALSGWEVGDVIWLVGCGCVGGW